MQKGTIITLNWLGIISVVLSYIFAWIALEELARGNISLPINIITIFDIFALIVFIMNIRFASKMKQ